MERWTFDMWCKPIPLSLVGRQSRSRTLAEGVHAPLYLVGHLQHRRSLAGDNLPDAVGRVRYPLRSRELGFLTPAGQGQQQVFVLFSGHFVLQCRVERLITVRWAGRRARVRFREIPDLPMLPDVHAALRKA